MLDIKENESSFPFSGAFQEAQWWYQCHVSLQSPPLHLEVSRYGRENHDCLLEADGSKTRAVCACVYLINTLKLFSDFLHQLQSVHPWMNVYKQLVFCHFLLVVIFWKVHRCVLFYSTDEDAEIWRSCYYRAKPRSRNSEDSAAVSQDAHKGMTTVTPMRCHQLSRPSCIVILLEWLLYHLSPLC